MVRKYKHENGKVSLEVHKEGGKLHRKGNPAWIKYHKNGTVAIEKYYQEGQLHRLNDPAWIEYDSQGNLRYVGWYTYDTAKQYKIYP